MIILKGLTIIKANYLCHPSAKLFTRRAFVRTDIGMHNEPGADFKIPGTISITKYPAAILGDETPLNANEEFDRG